MGTAAQIWMEQGRTEGKAAGIVEGKAAGIVEGKAAGIAEGKADTFLRQARLKFGHLSSERAERVRGATPEQLDAWLDALITAEDIDAVFGEPYPALIGPSSVVRTRFFTDAAPETVEEIMGTAAQIWMEQGRTEGKAAGIAEGKAAGIAEGKADTFLRQARLKFGHLSAERAERVRGATPEQLDAWLDALITAEDIDAVFGECTRH